MTNILEPDGLAGCFRCGYVWRARSLSPERCARCKSSLWDVPRLAAVKRGSGLGPDQVIGPHRPALLASLRAHKARNPRIFGSVLRHQATKSSDVDLLVDFEGEASMFDQIALRDDLERLFKRSVDVVSPEGLHWLVRPQVIFEAQPV